MPLPTEDELAAIAAAYALVRRAQPPQLPAPSRWKLAARAIKPFKR
jgi:hypothetical protein